MFELLPNAYTAEAAANDAAIGGIPAEATEASVNQSLIGISRNACANVLSLFPK